MTLPVFDPLLVSKLDRVVTVEAGILEELPNELPKELPLLLDSSFALERKELLEAR